MSASSSFTAADAASSPPAARPGVTPPDLREKGAGDARSDARLFMQLLVFTGHGLDAVALLTDAVNAEASRRDKTAGRPAGAVVYAAVNDPAGAAVLRFGSDLGELADAARHPDVRSVLTQLTPLPGFTMTGRTYSIGYERDLDDTLRGRPARTALNPDWPWAVWYPLRRAGAFSRLPDAEQKEILKEHGTIGMGFGAGDHAHDIRLACHGLDANDNDFVIGLTGKDPVPLSQLVQTMRGTVQTSQYLERLGPFFVGRAVHRVGSAELSA